MGKGRILLEAWAIPDSRFFAIWPLASRVNSPKIWVETYLARLQWNFCGKMGPFFLGGDAPRSSPRGGLGFRRKAKSPFYFINQRDLHLYNQLGCWACE
jgi:hypothetical protein